MCPLSENNAEVIFSKLEEKIGQWGLGLQVDEEVARRLAEYLGLLLEYGQRQNLVGDLSLSVLIERHVLDSMAAAALFPRKGTIADVGSGAGLPGIPLAMVLPECNIKLIESRQAKTTFLFEATRALGLGNVEVWNANVAELKEPVFDVVTSRAFGSIGKTLKVTRGLRRKPPGKTEYLLYKGRRERIEEELGEARGFSSEVIALPVCGEGMDSRHCVRLRVK